MSSTLSASALNSSNDEFNWVYLVEILVAGVLTLFTLFYFNRLFATLLSYIIRAWTWHKYRAYVDITALQISLLGGRVFFKSIRYHAHNETVLVHDGHITWRYWLRAVREAEIFDSEEEVTRRNEARSAGKTRSSSESQSQNDSDNGPDEKSRVRTGSIGKAEKAEKAGRKRKELPCRISVKVSGVEAFVYNRSPAYDMVIDAALKKARETQNEQSHENADAGSPSSTSQDEKEKDGARFGATAQQVDTHDTVETSDTANKQKPGIPSWLCLFPIKIECKRAAAAVGNEHTTSVITAKLEKAVGTIDAAHAGPLDIFKLLMEFEFEKVSAALKPNRDFKESQLDAAQRHLREREHKDLEQRDAKPKVLPKLLWRWRKFTSIFHHRRRSRGSVRTASMASVVENPSVIDRKTVPGESQWHGLARYLDDSDTSRQNEWDDVEYAKASTLVESEKLGFRFYFDQPGKVQSGNAHNDTLLGSVYEDDINGAQPPEYGMEFFVHGAMVVYGPWADRQRIILQHIFFPAMYADAIPAKPLRPGETRAWTIFKIYVSVEEDVVLRIPTRESSKDEHWQGRAAKSNPAQPQQGEEGGKHNRRRKNHRRQRKGKQGGPGIDARPYGWLDVTVKKDSTVNYRQDMFAHPDGYRNYLDLDVKGTEMTSSVNHGLLWRAGHLTLDADLSNQCAWNKLRKWPFNIVCDDLELFILRDHFFLIIDIVNDWASGPPPDFYTFVPYFYNLNMEFRNWCMYLNVNDANIINDPAAFDKNDFLTLEGRSLQGKLGIPMEFFRPNRNEITWDVLSVDMRMRMLSPPRSTLAFLIKDKQVAELPKLTLKGSFDQNGESRPGLTDVLRFDIWASGLKLKAYGQLVRQLVSLKENYFGDYIHFKTLDEFQDAAEDLDKANAKTASTPPQTPNEMDVILCIIVEDTTVMLPTNLYSANEYVRIELPLANLDLRIVSYYLDMGLNLSPVSLLSGTSRSDEDESSIESASNTQIYVSHTDLYGHRSFGLPPVEPAYLSQWEINVGSLTGECSSGFVHDLALAGRAFAFGFQDGDNKLPVVSPNVYPDVTFVQVRTGDIRVWLHIGKDALLVAAEPVSIDTNDLARGQFSQRINVLAPLVTIACVDARSASRKRVREGRKSTVKTFGFLQSGAAVDVLIRSPQFDEKRRQQQAHIRQSDQRTRRVPFLQHGKDDLPEGYADVAGVQPPYLPYPCPPPPIISSGQATGRPSSIKSVHTFRSGRSGRSDRTASSLSGSLRGSIALTQNAPKAATSHPSNRRSPISHRGNNESEASSNIYERRGVLPDDRERAEFGLPPSSVAFSSSFAEPYFPLDIVDPDETNVPRFVMADDNSDASSETSSIADAIRDPNGDPQAQHTSVFIRLQPGIRAYLEPQIGILVAKLVDKILPKAPEDIMDSFQMNVMGAVVAEQQERHGTASVLEINANLPSARIRVLNTSTDENVSDQLDLNIARLVQMVRVRTIPSAEGAAHALALHTVLDSLGATLYEIHANKQLTQSIKLTVNDILIWVALGSNRSVHTSVHDIQVVVNGLQAQHLAQLPLRLVPLVNDLMDNFADSVEKQRKKLLLLIYELTTEGENVGDPLFLTRMTYILRAFPDHFRNQESWKVLARFRYLLDTFPEDRKERLRAKYEAEELDIPGDAPRQVVESWGQWRNWDVININDTLAFRMLYSQAEARPMEEPKPLPMSLVVRSDLLRVAIEHKSQSSEVAIEEVSLGLENTPPVQPTGLMLVEENKRTKTTLQLHTNLVGISMDWSLIHVAEALLPFVADFESLTASQKAAEHRNASALIGDELARHDFHIVFSTDNCNIKLHTIHLRNESRVQGLKLSLIGTTQANEQYGQCASALVNVDHAVSELHGPSSQIMKTVLKSPSLYIDHLQPTSTGAAPPAVTIATAYNDLDIAVTEQLPGILHIVDSIVLQEVTKILQLVKIAPPRRPVSARTGDDGSQLGVDLNVAVLAGTLHVEVSLLQSLSYRLDGRAASVRVTPRVAGSKVASVDFDMGRQSHGFVNLSKDERHHQGMLELPPINGHVGLELSAEETSVSATSTVERIEVDAAGIQGIIVVISKPEVQHVFSAVSTTIQDIQHHVEELDTSPAMSTTQSNEGHKVLFDIRFALLGVRVSSTTPQVKGRSTAELEFGIGPLHATASNRRDTSDGNQLIPEVRAQIQDIGARLWVNERGKHYPCGNVALGMKLHFDSDVDEHATMTRKLNITSDELEINAYPETASTAVDVINHLQDRMRDLDLSKEVEYLRRLRDSRKHTVIRRLKAKRAQSEDDPAFSAADLLSVRTTFTLRKIHATWLVDRQFAALSNVQPQDAVFTISSVEFTTSGGQEARLTINEIMLQLAQKRHSLTERSMNSALIPKVEFTVAYWSQRKNRSLAFKATGMALDLRLESRFIVPFKAVQNSIESAIDRFKIGTATWRVTPTASGAPRQSMFDIKRIASVLIEADFAGAQVYLQGSGRPSKTLGALAASSQDKQSQHGRYGQFAAEGELMHTTLKSPGIALKLEYNASKEQPTVHGEMRVDASTNLLLPNVVPLVLEISNSIKEVLQTKDSPKEEEPKAEPEEVGRKSSQRFFDDESIVSTNPTSLFGKTKVDLGLRVCRQEFGLSCQPIARVDAKATLDDFYFAVNTIESEDYGHFFAMSAVVTKLAAQVKHVYSREPTFSFDMESVELSLMNSKHLSGANGISAIVKINPTTLSVNGKQMQDLLLFREIWLPPELRDSGPSSASAPVPSTRPDDYIVQKYQLAAAAAAFPWNATVSIAKLAIDLDLGQSIGKTSFAVTNLWASQQKSSNWVQNLCIGLDEVVMNSTGRMSGFIELSKLGIRTSITWPRDVETEGKTPLIQASLGFGRLRAKAAFDYQAFAFGDIEGFDFLMYNVREKKSKSQNSDRLVAVLDCDKAYVFCTSTSPAQALGLFQAFDRLIQEKQTAYMQSLKDIEKHVRRESTIVPTRFGPTIPNAPVQSKNEKRSPISLHTDVVLTLGTISVGVYPSTFFDAQILKLEANNIQARFAVGLERGQIHSGLGMNMGQLQVALASVKRMTAVPKALEVSVDEVIGNATAAKGGTIVRVPRVTASMQTWQAPDSNKVDFVFKSLFEGKIDVGWNLSRINFIKSMWTTHSRALASRLGKPLPESAVKIKAGSDDPSSHESTSAEERAQQEKITAEVNLPQSRYEYRALEPPVIETPQLRDMGEATPPLEWIGLNRERLPNVMHQIVIVSLLEVAKEVEDAYERILGSSG